jgi:tetratricopeptide (TPR) repeat protein
LEVLDLWPFKAGLKEQAGAIEKELEAPAVKLAIRAAIGSGRHSVVKLLSSSMDLAVIELPSFEDLDAPLHGLVQLASQAGTLDTVLQAVGTDFLKKTELSAQALAAADRAVVVLLPVPRPGTPRETDAATRDRVEKMLAVLVNVPSLRVAVLATPGTRLRDGFTTKMELVAPRIGAPQIHANELPGEFGAAAHALASWMNRTGWASTPVEARLQIGLIALGQRPEEVALRLEALARKMIQQLQRWPALAVAVHRLLLARRALPIKEVSEVSGVEPRWQPLLTACIGYGDDKIRVPEVTRQVLLDALKASAPALEDAHRALAQHHESLDGARSLRSLGQDQAINWLEKVHHLALGGAACAARWSEQEPAGREQLWERARYLSRELHQFPAAAEIYQACIDKFGEDPYSKHYLAYNLERARGSLEGIRRGYAYAARAEPENPWWQQRWVRFLIAHGTLAEARAAWQHAIRWIDPDGTRLRNSPWLALNLHFWVARRWLALGRLEDAREVLAEVPERWLEQESELRELVQRLTAHEQALALGESVYPTSTPIADRWKRPRTLRLLRSGRRLVSWAPGRVVDVSPTSVTIVIAPTPDEAQQLSFDAETWRLRSGEPAEDADGFFEIGTYEGGEQIVRLVPDDGEGARLDPEEADLLARVATCPP